MFGPFVTYPSLTSSVKHSFDFKNEEKIRDMEKKFQVELNRLEVRLSLWDPIDVSGAHVPHQFILFKRDLGQDGNNRIAAMITKHDKQLKAQRVSVDLCPCLVPS